MEGIVFLLLVTLMTASLLFLVPYQLYKMINFPTRFFAFGHFC